MGSSPGQRQGGELMVSVSAELLMQKIRIVNPNFQ